MSKLVSLEEARIVEDIRIYSVGDIHGRIDLLKNLISKIQHDSENSEQCQFKLIFLGDYVDRGPDSKAVIDYLKNLTLPDFEIICLRGNHEQRFLEFLDNPENDPAWLDWGGLDTLKSYDVDINFDKHDKNARQKAANELASLTPETHVNFIRNLPCQYICGDYFFVHAGINPSRPLENQDEHDLMWIRKGFIHEQTLYEKVIVHGHTISETAELLDNRIGIDTGAYYTNCLSSIVLWNEKKKLLQT